MPTNTTHTVAEVDPDRNGHDDPGSTPQEHIDILDREVTTFFAMRRKG